jgi:SAM-dependent methyltransferase
MYEANPYPRRVGVHRPAPVPLDHTLATVGLRAPPRRPLSVLVAGGGTGQHPLQTATRYAEVSVLAIDLSRASLGRAARVARSHGIDDVRFAQADLLALGGLDERFDVIESVGVLHHLGEPLAGWRVLRGLLADDGVMRIGLYAERGRADVVAARALVAEWGLPPTPEGLREARRRFLTLPAEHPARPITRSPDFPSLSGLRDLVFHVCEHRYTLPRLAAELDELGLTFAGFQHTLPEAAHRYRERWPDDPAQCDLARWDALEAEHPHLFRGMYVFWCAPTP